MSTKAALKPIIAAIKAEKYDDAIKDAEKLLASDPKNHQA
jgi:superkiller protein 3